VRKHVRVCTACLRSGLVKKAAWTRLRRVPCIPLKRSSCR